MLALNSPVLGLYKYLSLLVKMVVLWPDVVFANIGYKLFAVVVSFDIVPMPDGPAAPVAPAGPVGPVAPVAPTAPVVDVTCHVVES